MPDWSIMIVEGDDGTTQFQPKQVGAKPGDPLQAYQDDVVSWNNTTEQTHQPWPTDENYKPLPSAQVKRGKPLYMSDPIPGPDESSRPAYGAGLATRLPDQIQKPAVPWTIYYYCKKHPKAKSERGTINVALVPVVNIPD